MDLVLNKERKIHVSRLKPFIFDPLVTDPLDIARRDYGQYLVKEILTHNGDPKRRLLMKFRVHWLGFDEEEDHTWESFKTLRLIPCLHEYLSNNNLTSLIPKEFRI